MTSPDAAPSADSRAGWLAVPPPEVSLTAVLARVLLGAFLFFAGIGHWTFSRETFQAQVPPWVPLDPDFVVLASGVVEIALGSALMLLPRWRVPVGWVTAAFFVAIFPGNLAQWTEQRDAFGLESDAARVVRLFFQPVLIAWALWCTGAWKAWRRHRA